MVASDLLENSSLICIILHQPLQQVSLINELIAIILAHQKNNQKLLRPDFTEKEYQNRNAYGLPKIKTANKSIMSYIQASRNATRQRINTEDDSRGTDSSLSCNISLSFAIIILISSWSSRINNQA